MIQRNGDVQATFLVDGFVAGTWQIADGRVRLEPFERLGAETDRELESEARALETFYAA